MAKVTSEKALVTTDAMQQFIDTFKNKVFNWADPSGTGIRDWLYSDTSGESSIDKSKSKNKIEGLVPASKQDILDLFK